jgi:hypothetical protein
MSKVLQEANRRVFRRAQHERNLLLSPNDILLPFALSMSKGSEDKLGEILREVYPEPSRRAQNDKEACVILNEVKDLSGKFRAAHGLSIASGS